MSNNTQVTLWPPTASIAGKLIMAIDENNVPYLLQVSAFLNSGYQGKAFTDTDPGTLTQNEKGYWYFCGEAGTFTNFDGLSCNMNDQLWWNGTSWDLIPAISAAPTPKFEANATQGQTDFTLTVALTVNDLVHVNGRSVRSSEYSGIGTTTLTFAFGLDLGDFVIVK